MPPRISSSRVSNSLLPYLSSHSACPSSSSSSSLLSIPSYPSPSACTSQSSCRPFSSTLSTRTRLRNQMFEWLNTEGTALKNHIPGTTNYLTDIKDRKAKAQEKSSDKSADGSASAEGATSGASGNEERSRTPRPFPLNPSFASEPILSEELRNEIYQRVVVQKRGVRAVSVELGVDMRRVGAVVRLVELERRWKREGKPLALPYARAIHEMVPNTPLAEQGQPQIHHETINDLPVHRLTDPQIFYPVSESRQFTRIDAGRVFSGAPALEHSREAELKNADPADLTSHLTRHPEEIERVGKGADEIQVLQPADVRIPHPHLISFERDRRANPSEHRERMKRYEQRLKEEEAAEQERKQLAQERREKKTTHVEPESSRFEFRFKDVVVSRETTGPDGRGSDAPGRRYGVPSYERKKGSVKIPTKVEV